MARARDPFGNALAALRNQLRDGGFAAGAPLVAAELAPALAVSITPVREALAHLAGEGLIEERRGRGYFAPRLEVAELEGLYRLHWVYVKAALREPGWPPRAPIGHGAWNDENDPYPMRTATERLFAAAVRASDNRLMTIAHQKVVDRLAAPRLQESSLFEDIEPELQHLTETFGSGDRQAARAGAGEYHVRRLDHAKRLATQMLEAKTLLL